MTTTSAPILRRYLDILNEQASSEREKLVQRLENAEKMANNINADASEEEWEDAEAAIRSARYHLRAWDNAHGVTNIREI